MPSLERLVEQVDPDHVGLHELSGVEMTHLSSFELRLRIWFDHLSFDLSKWKMIISHLGHLVLSSEHDSNIIKLTSRRSSNERAPIDILHLLTVPLPLIGSQGLPTLADQYAQSTISSDDPSERK